MKYTYNRSTLEGLGTRLGLGFNSLRAFRFFLCPTIVMKPRNHFFFNYRAQTYHFTYLSGKIYDVITELCETL